VDNTGGRFKALRATAITFQRRGIVLEKSFATLRGMH